MIEEQNTENRKNKKIKTVKMSHNPRKGDNLRINTVDIYWVEFKKSYMQIKF